MAVRRNYIQAMDFPSGASAAQVALAEEVIDEYVGFQPRFFPGSLRGSVTAASNSNKTFADTSNTSQLSQLNGFFIGAVLEIVGGTGSGQILPITDSNRDAKSVTVGAAFTTNPDTTSIFRIYQLAKFPRNKDVTVSPDGLTFYKSIPQAVKEAVIAEAEYIVAQGDSFFADDSTDAQAESIGNYSYSGGSGQSASVKMVAPKARLLLRGIMNRTGRLVAENPTSWPQ